MEEIWSKSTYESIFVTADGKSYTTLCYKLGTSCRVTGLLELWSYDESSIRSLTRDQILTTVNTTNKSPVFGTDLDVKNYLGGFIRRNGNGMIIGAEATQMLWLLKPSVAAKEWEAKVIERALQGHKDLKNVYVYASRSFQDEGYGAINSDIKLLSAGFSIVFVFVMISLGNFNMVEQRIIVSLLGLGSVGLAILFAYGIATFLDVIYGPIQSIMPFLLLGIGVDDMFVIVEAWRNLSPNELKLPLPERIGTVLKHAGVSVTVTSITDVVAFGIGASTVIPALSAFCIYAALGIFALYILQSTFFVACLAIDARRRQAHRNACICCYKHQNYKPNSCSQKAFLPVFFEKYFGPFLMKLPVKIIVMLIVAILVGVNLWRFILLKQDFNLTNYIPSDSYAYDYAKAKERYFVNEGTDTAVYCGDINYFDHIRKLDVVHHLIESDTYIQDGTLISWFKSFQQYQTATGVPITTEAEFNSAVFQFTKTAGQNLKTFIKFNSTREPVRIISSYFTMKHTLQPDSAGEIDAMQSLRSIIDNGMFPLYNRPDQPTYKCFSYSRNYLTYETNKVLLNELYRNLGLAGACVLVVTLILIANLWTSLLVFSCVVFTLICVAGTLELWGVTIDTASSVLMILSVGLAVDYSAHVGHTFMTISGNRQERSLKTLKSIGPAVFNGGFSTFLAFVLLSTSTSYGFSLFFRVFFSVVVFGLFHGLCYLPVVLSWVGPAPYDSALPTKSQDVEINTSSKNISNGNSQPLDGDFISSSLIQTNKERKSQVSPIEDVDISNNGHPADIAPPDQGDPPSV
ncbi:patched domain-containing protein 3 [Patella vulgata]|uniref:patched domain-containing protein 3 n=1 Tax=Patella vulgata TaxID=6465 RepID=UPI0024A93C2B|nr:patched domain-containing protein 3 [Patella vulgata]